MKNLSNLALATAVILTTSGLRAAETTITEPKRFESGLLKLDVGVSLQGDIDISQFAGFAAEGKLEFDPGVRVSLAIGGTKRLADRVSLRFEFETGFLLNEMTRLSGPGGSVSTDGSHVGVPLCLNFVPSYELTERLKAFAGVGAGLLVSTMNVNQIADARVGESSTTMLPVAQWTLGLDYSLSDKFSLIVEYKGMALFSASYSFALGTANTETEFSLNHSILAGVGFKF